MDDISKTPDADINVNPGPSIPVPSGKDGDLREKDKAAQVLQQAGHRVELTPENNKRVLRIIDWKVLPIILGM